MAEDRNRQARKERAAEGTATVGDNGGDQQSREQIKGIAVVEEAAEVLEWVYSLAGG